MNTLKILSFVGKFAGFVTALHAVPYIPPEVGLYIFAGASLLKDAVNRFGDLVDDGKENQSFKS
jgi:hypothetical protein